MRRITLLPIVLGALALPSITVAAGGPQHRAGRLDGRGGTVWVVNRDQGEVSIFDATSGLLLATEPTGAGAHEVAISKRAHKAYITNETDNAVSIVSTRTLEDSELPLGPAPHHAEPSRDGRTILVGLVGTNAVARIDAKTGEVSRTYTSSANAAASASTPGTIPTSGASTVWRSRRTGRNDPDPGSCGAAPQR